MIHRCAYCCGEAEVCEADGKVYVMCMLCDYSSRRYSVKFLGREEATKLAIKDWNEWIHDYPKADLF